MVSSSLRAEIEFKNYKPRSPAWDDTRTRNMKITEEIKGRVQDYVRERVDMEVLSLLDMLRYIDADFEWTAYEEDGDLHIGVRTDYGNELLPGFTWSDTRSYQYQYQVNPTFIAIGHLRIDVQYIEDKVIGKVAIITDNDEKTETEMRVVLAEPKVQYTTSQKAVAVLTDKGFKAETFPAMNDDVMLYVNTEMFILSETDVCRLANEYDNNNKI